MDADVVVRGRHVGDYGPIGVARSEEGEPAGDVNREEGKTVFLRTEPGENDFFHVEGVEGGGTRVGEDELVAHVEDGEVEEV